MTEQIFKIFLHIIFNSVAVYQNFEKISGKFWKYLGEIDQRGHVRKIILEKENTRRVNNFRNILKNYGKML